MLSLLQLLKLLEPTRLAHVVIYRRRAQKSRGTRERDEGDHNHGGRRDHHAKTAPTDTRVEIEAKSKMMKMTESCDPIESYDLYDNENGDDDKHPPKDNRQPGNLSCLPRGPSHDNGKRCNRADALACANSRSGVPSGMRNSMLRNRHRRHAVS